MGSILANLLVSDDEPQVLEFIRRVLTDAGHSVVATTDPGQVQALASRTGEAIDAVVLDVNMPISGFEVLNRLRGDVATSDLPILFLSGLGSSRDRVRGLQEGADDYMVKPFEPDELLFRIERLLEQRERTGAVDVPVVASDISAADIRDKVSGEDVSFQEGRLRFGRYEVLEVIGQGSMGTVYRGHDPRLERPVALKTIRLEALSSDTQRLEMLDRLRHEAVTIARCAHPNIISVFDMGGVEYSAFIAMEMVDGISLRDLIKREGPLGTDRALPVALYIARGLEAAHGREVIHRDVKPGNVLLGFGGEIKVSDFGLAFVVSAMSTDSTEISGTPGYVPPEVMHQKPYSEAGDVFGFGATLYEALTATHPLAGATLRDTIMNTLRGTVRSLHELAPEVPDDLAALVMVMLSTEPEDRPTMSEVVSTLEEMVRARDLRWDPAWLPRPNSSPQTPSLPS